MVRRSGSPKVIQKGLPRAKHLGSPKGFPKPKDLGLDFRKGSRWEILMGSPKGFPRETQKGLMKATPKDSLTVIRLDFPRGSGSDFRLERPKDLGLDSLRGLQTAIQRPKGKGLATHSDSRKDLLKG
jgi:hypothetical protein